MDTINNFMEDLSDNLEDLNERLVDVERNHVSKELEKSTLTDLFEMVGLIKSFPFKRFYVVLNIPFSSIKFKIGMLIWTDF